MELKKVKSLAGLLCGLLMNTQMCVGNFYSVVYDGNGATSGKMDKHTYIIGASETTELDANAYKRSYTLSYDVNGGTTIEPTKVDYTFNGWLHDTLLTEVSNNFKANWTAMSYNKYDDEVPGMFTFSNYNGVNNYAVNTSVSCWEHLYSKAIYMPAGTFTLNFKESSSTGIVHLSIENSWLFKVSVCDQAQTLHGGDKGILTSGDSSSAVVIDTKASTEMKNYSFSVFSVGGPVYISINGGNLYDGRTYKLSFSDFVLSYNGSTSLTYADKEPTLNMVREEGGTVKLKAIWEPASATLPTPEKEGYTFVGWSTNANGTGELLAAGDTYTPTEDTKFYAIWKEIEEPEDEEVEPTEEEEIEPTEEVEPIEEEEQDTTLTMLPVIPAKIVTPNGDGINDTWTIKNLDQFSIYKVTIYDRFGKKLITYKNNYPGFDGTYNGNALPSTDYWFVIDIEDIDKQMTGHFTLLH